MFWLLIFCSFSQHEVSTCILEFWFSTTYEENLSFFLFICSYPLAILYVLTQSLPGSQPRTQSYISDLKTAQTQLLVWLRFGLKSTSMSFQIPSLKIQPQILVTARTSVIQLPLIKKLGERDTNLIVPGFNLSFCVFSITFMCLDPQRSLFLKSIYYFYNNNSSNMILFYFLIN